MSPYEDWPHPAFFKLRALSTFSGLIFKGLRIFSYYSRKLIWSCKYCKNCFFMDDWILQNKAYIPKGGGKNISQKDIITPILIVELWDKYGENTYRTIFSNNHRLYDYLHGMTLLKKVHIVFYPPPIMSPPPQFSQQDRDPNIRYTCTTLWCNVKLLLLPQLFALCGKPFCFSYASFYHSITERSFISKS